MNSDAPAGLDLTWPPESSNTDSTPAPAGRPWVGIQFECCEVYTRVYRDPGATFYEGRCPKCGRPVRVQVAPGGVSARLLRAKVV